MNNTIYFVTGPTAIGKSEYAISLSKSLDGEIINADSIQIYKDLKIISAPCYMMNAKVDEVYNNIKMAVDKLSTMIERQ